MSASLTETHTWMRVRSLAIRKRLGAFRLDTTVWPMLTRRSMITPLTGDLIVQYSRFCCARLRFASAWKTVSLACTIAASPTATLALAVSYADW